MSPVASILQVCCSQRDGLVQALQQLMARSTRFDAILVETSGLANPGPIAGVFWTDAEETASLQLDSVLTVIDAAHFELQMDLAAAVGACGELEDQVGYADTIIVNKIDAVAPDVLTRVESRLRGMGDADVILRASYGVVPLDRILHRCCYATAGRGALLSRRLQRIEPALPRADSALASAAALPSVHAHSEGVSAVELQCSLPVNIEAVERWLGALLWDKELLGAVGEGSAGRPDALQPLLILRVKGLLFGSRAPTEPSGWFLLQSVHELFEVSPLTGAAALESAASRPPGSRVIVIGRGLAEGALQRSFSAACQCLPLSSA